MSGPRQRCGLFPFLFPRSAQAVLAKEQASRRPFFSHLCQHQALSTKWPTFVAFRQQLNALSACGPGLHQAFLSAFSHPSHASSEAPSTRRKQSLPRSPPTDPRRAAHSPFPRLGRHLRSEQATTGGPRRGPRQRGHIWSLSGSAVTPHLATSPSSLVSSCLGPSCDR